MSEENKIELANCPFCGSSRIEQVSFNLGALVQLECNGCRLKTPRFSSIEAVSNFWNSRADNPRLAELEKESKRLKSQFEKIKIMKNTENTEHAREIMLDAVQIAKRKRIFKVLDEAYDLVVDCSQTIGLDRDEFKKHFSGIVGDYKMAKLHYDVIGEVEKMEKNNSADVIENHAVAERRVTYQHEDTGNIFTKLIPENEPIPEFPRRFVVSVEPV